MGCNALILLKGILVDTRPLLSAYFRNLQISIIITQEVNVTLIERLIFMEIIVLIGRVLFGYIFIGAGIAHLKDFKHTAEIAAKSKAPFPNISALIMIFLAIVGGLSIAFGYYTRIGAISILLFLIPTTFIVHRFWGHSDKALAAMHLPHFNKNVALIGMTLLLYYFGPGPFRTKVGGIK